MASEKRPYNCAIEATLSQIGGKYKAIIIYHLLEEKVLRYNELQKYVPNATPRMLTLQLRELESCGLISRKVYPVVPPKTEYSLTELGETLSPIVTALKKWGEEHMQGTF